MPQACLEDWMNDSNMTAELVSQGYFAAVIRGMKNAGFSMIARVDIRSDLHKIRYHVPLADGTVARNIRLFFRPKGKLRTAIFCLEFDENQTHLGKEDGSAPCQPRKTVKVHFWSRSRSWQDLLSDRSLRDRWYKADPDDDDPPGLVPTVDRRLEVPEGFAWGNSHRFATYPEGDEASFFLQGEERATEFMRPRTVITAVTVVWQQFDPVTRDGRFDELSVLSFMPYYTYGLGFAGHGPVSADLERTFWEQFGVERLRALVGRPYGSSLIEQ